MNKTSANSVRITIVLAVILSGCFGYVLYKDTLVAGWIPVCAAAIIAVTTVTFHGKWKFVTGTRSKPANMICHLLCIGTISYTLLITANFYLRDTDNPKTVTATVVRKYSETKEVRNRTGRHRYHTSRVRRYYMDVRFDDGTAKEIRVSHDFYKAVDSKTVDLVIEKGFFGFYVIAKLP